MHSNKKIIFNSLKNMLNKLISIFHQYKVSHLTSHMTLTKKKILILYIMSADKIYIMSQKNYISMQLKNIHISIIFTINYTNHS